MSNLSWQRFLEDGLPLLIAAATAALSFVQADPKYVEFGAPLAIAIKTLNSLVSSQPATPAAAVAVVAPGAVQAIQAVLALPNLTATEKQALELALTVAQSKVPIA